MFPDSGCQLAESPLSALPGLTGLTVEPASGQIAPASSAVANLHEDVEATRLGLSAARGHAAGALPRRRAHADAALPPRPGCMARDRAAAGRRRPDGAHRCARAFGSPSDVAGGAVGGAHVRAARSLAATASLASASSSVRLGSAERRVALDGRRRACRGDARRAASVTAQRGRRARYRRCSAPAPGAADGGHAGERDRQRSGGVHGCTAKSSTRALTVPSDRVRHASVDADRQARRSGLPAAASAGSRTVMARRLARRSSLPRAERVRPAAIDRVRPASLEVRAAR